MLTDRPRPSVLLLSCNDRDLMRELVASLEGPGACGPAPQIAVDGADASASRVAVFIEAVDPSRPPGPWQGWSDGILYDSPAAYRILGFVRVDPQSPPIPVVVDVDGPDEAASHEQLLPEH